MMINHWWQQRPPRERLLIGSAALLLLLLLADTLLWSPYWAERELLQQRVDEQQQTLHWMRGAAVEIAQLRGSGGSGVPLAGGSLLAQVDSSAKRQGLGSMVKRVQPNSSSSVQVWLEQAPLDKLLRWIDQITASGTIRIAGLVLDRADRPGMANARLVLESGE